MSFGLAGCCSWTRAQIAGLLELGPWDHRRLEVPSPHRRPQKPIASLGGYEFLSEEWFQKVFLDQALNEMAEQSELDAVGSWMQSEYESDYSDYIFMSCRSFMSRLFPSSLLRWSHLAEKMAVTLTKRVEVYTHSGHPHSGPGPLSLFVAVPLRCFKQVVQLPPGWGRLSTWESGNDRFSWKCTAFSDRQARRSKEHHATSKIFITRQHLTCCWYVFSVFIDIQARLPGHGLLGWRPPLWKRDGRYQGTVSLREGKHIQNQPKNPEPVWKLVKFPEGMVAQASQRRRLSRTRLRSELSRCGAGANAPNGKQFWRIQELDFESFDVQTCSKQHFTVTVAGRHGLCTVSEPEAFHGTRGPKKAILKLTFLGTLPRTNGQRTLHIARSKDI